MNAPTSWRRTSLSCLVTTVESGSRPAGGVSAETGEIASLGGENILQSGGITLANVKRVPFSFFKCMARGHLADADVLINKDGAQTGKVGFFLKRNAEAACINEHVFLVRGDKEKIRQDFLYYTLLSESSQRQIAAQISGSAQPGLKSDFLRGVVGEIPESTVEQGKIAEILETIDRAIQQTEALIAKEQRIKTGLMQDLLSRGLDEHGNLRTEESHVFKNSPLGQIPMEWSMGTLLDVTERSRQPILTGPFGADLGEGDFVEEGVPVLRIGNVQRGKLDLSDLLFVSSEKAAELARYRVKTGDLLFARQGATTGRNALASKDANGCLINYHIIRVALDHNRCAPRFIEALFDSESIKRQVDREKGRGTREGINTAQLKALQLKLPTVHEQRDIASLLEVIDRQDAKTHQLNAKLHRQKAALMQDLLSGRKRVTLLLKAAQATGERW